MEAARLSWVSVDDYLREERTSPVRHEYVAGAVYAMAGASEEHTTIAGNLHAALHAHLRGKSRKVFMVDMKLRLAAGPKDAFYYPDVMVTCDPRDTDRYSKRFPKVVVEVLSPDTERIDCGEKFLAYTNVETLDEYVLIAQDRTEVTVFRRSTDWTAEILADKNDELVLTSIDFSIRLASVFEGVG